MMSDRPAKRDESRRISLSKEGAIGWLELHNPARMNAMSMSMWESLAACVTELAADDAVRVIVVRGHGGKAFCAGGDVSEFADLRNGPDATARYDAAGKAAMDTLYATPKPTIAMIEGYCLGGGLGLALQCDLRIAASDALLGIPAAKRALAYSFAGVKQLVDLVGPAHAKNILFSARQFNVQEAQAMGLVTDVADPPGLRDLVVQVAGAIATNAPLSVQASKLMVNTATADPQNRDIDRCKAAEAACLESEDYAEATRSFLEKRRPVFHGR